MRLRNLSFTCAICKKRIEPDDDVQQDHIIPIKRGGPTVSWNLRLVHAICNLHKSDHIESVQIPLLYYGSRNGAVALAPLRPGPHKQDPIARTLVKETRREERKAKRKAEQASHIARARQAFALAFPDLEEERIQLENLKKQVAIVWTERWNDVLSMYEEKHLTFQAIGDELNISRARAHQLYKKAKRNGKA